MDTIGDHSNFILCQLAATLQSCSELVDNKVICRGISIFLSQEIFVSRIPMAISNAPQRSKGSSIDRGVLRRFRVFFTAYSERIPVNALLVNG